MTTIVDFLDAEITRLQQARSILTGNPDSGRTHNHRATTTLNGHGNPEPAVPKKRRKMSAAARKRIGDAQRARWAAQKKVRKQP